jgi:predicted AAA+ superfamily ATPase
MNVEELVQPYSPWMSPKTLEEWRKRSELIPEFHRPIFNRLVEDIESIGQMVSVTGPRRVGKSTLLIQLVQHLINRKNVDPSRVVYYSFDDPALFLRHKTGGDLVESLMERSLRMGEGQTYLLLDEIQKLDRWEQFLKKYYDLHYPVRIVISGSASSPIFKKSRESLLGRVKDYHLLPFSFREFLLYEVREEHALREEVETLAGAGACMRGMFAKDPDYYGTQSVTLPDISDELWARSESAMRRYLVDGGFPEVWQLPTAEKKIEYLFDNQVNKVISEDLVLAVEFRKPEQLKVFYVSLLEQPGREVNLTTLSQEIGVGVQQIDKYLPLLEMTDLLAHAGKFRTSPVRLRRGNRKYYLVDLALRNAVLRIGEELLNDADMMGLYAENLVFNALRKWEGVLQIDYYRHGKHEVDFVVHTGPSRYLPAEVKYRENVTRRDLRGLTYFRTRYRCHLPILVTKNKEDFGWREDDRVFFLPLIYFLLLFD